MAKGDTFFLRTTLTSATNTYVSDDIDISAYTDPSRGKILVVDRAFVTFGTDGNGPIVTSDVGTTMGSRNMGAQACSESQTGLVQTDNNSLFLKCNFYASIMKNETSSGTFSGPAFSMINEENALNPANYMHGFPVPTDKIHCGIQTGTAWSGEIDVGFLFEVHTEKLSLSKLQELLVSLTA